MEAITQRETTPWNGRSLKAIFDAISSGCPQGPRETVTEETMLNPHNFWEMTWGRTDASWPRRGFSDCWSNRGTVCPLPDRDNTVCLPPSRRGSAIAKGWALDPKGQACKPGVHCLYACEPGYYWTTYNQQETSNYDHENAHQRGHCDGTWNYGTSSHGVLCKQDGTLDIPGNKPLCQLGETYVYAENRLDTHVFLCQTVFPGHEIFLIPTLVRPGESVMITTQPVDFWHGPSYDAPTHGDFYVSFAGADIMEACTWDEFSPSGAALLPYEIGSGVEDNGVVYSTHYFYQQPNSEVPENHVGYQMDLECESSEQGVCGPVFRSHNVVKADVLRKPRRAGSTKVKFVFRKPQVNTGFGTMYREPPQSYSTQSQSYTTTTTTESYGEHSHVQSSAHSDGTSSSISLSGGTSGGYAGGATSVRPDFTQQHNRGLRENRRMKTPDRDAQIYLHNTLTTPIVICSDAAKAGGRGASVGPGEKIQLEKQSLLKISAHSGSAGCRPEADYHWHLTTGNQSGEALVYSYAQTQSLEGHRLSLECVSEDDACALLDARSVSVPLETSSSPEITFVVQSSAPPSAGSQSYAWGGAIQHLVSRLVRSPST